MFVDSRANWLFPDGPSWKNLRENQRS